MKFAKALTILESLLGTARTGVMRKHISDVERQALSVAVDLLRRIAFAETGGLALVPEPAPKPDPTEIPRPEDVEPPPSPVRKSRRKRKPEDDDIPF